MTDKTDALVALDIAIAQATQSRVSLHLTRAKQLREALAEQPVCTCPSGDGSLRWPCPSHSAEQPAGAVAWLGVNHRTGEPEISTHKPASSVMRDFNMRPLVYADTTSPAASVTVTDVDDGLTAAYLAGRYDGRGTASVDVDCLKQIRALLQSLPGAQGREHIDLGIRLNRLIDSAGGAKGEYTVLRPDGTHYTTDVGGADMARKREGYRVLAESTPQPDGGDGAVGDTRCDQYVLDGFNGERKCANKRAPGDTLCKRHRATAEKTGYAPARPSAAAAVPLAGDSFGGWAAWLRDRGQSFDPYIQGPMFNQLADWMDSLAAAPAAPKGGVVDEAARALVEKIEAIHADPRYQSVWVLAHNHGVPYTGPKYDTELAALTAALATPRAEQEAG